MKEAGLSKEHQERYASFSLEHNKPIEEEKITVFYMNITAFNWFKDHPFIWKKERGLLFVNEAGNPVYDLFISGLDYQGVASLMRLDGIGKKSKKILMQGLSQIEIGVVEESKSQFYKLSKSLQ